VKVSLRKSITFHVWAGQHSWSAEYNKAGTDWRTAVNLFRYAKGRYPYARLVQRSHGKSCICCDYRLKVMISK
jgi:hypothetical protein